MQSSLTPKGAREELERRQAARSELARRKVSSSFQAPKEEPHNPSFWEKMGPGGEKYLSEQEKKRIVESDPQLMMNAASMMAPFGQAGKLLGQNAGTLARGTANVAGRIGQAGGYSGLESWAKNHGAGEGFGSGALFQGAIEGAIPALKGVGHAATTYFSHIPAVQKIREHLGINELKNNIQNIINEHILKESKKEGGPRSPEQTHQLMQEQYLGTEGQHLPVDIGTLTGEPASSVAYKATKYLPNTETPKKLNFIQQQQNEVERMKLQKESEEENKNISNEQRMVKEKKQSILNEANPFRESRDTIAKRLGELAENKSAAVRHIEPAPNILNRMHEERLNRNAEGEPKFGRHEIPQMHAHDVNKLYNQERKEVKEIYGPLNKSDLHVEIEPKKDFEEYTAAVKELQKEGSRISQILGTELNPSIKAQIKAGEAFLDNGKPYAVQVKDMVTHMQNLGKAAHKLREAGENKAAAAVENLDRTMHQGFIAAMKNAGEEKLANAYVNGTKAFRERIVPFWENSTIRHAAEGGIPKENSLSKALHETGNTRILAKLPVDTQKSMGAELIGKGKGEAGGLTNLSPEQLAQSYAGMSKNVKASIAKYAPQENAYFESLKKALKEHKLMEKEHKKSLEEHGKHESNINRIEEKAERVKEAPNETTLSQRLLRNLEENEKKRLEMQPKGGFIPKMAAAGFLGAGLKFPTSSLALGMAGAPIARLLRDPKMLEAYMKQQPLEVRKSLLSKLKELGPRFAAASTQGNE